jgi:phenylalanyl-tRNA synthetase alpha subunit
MELDFKGTSSEKAGREARRPARHNRIRIGYFRFTRPSARQYSNIPLSGKGNWVEAGAAGKDKLDCEKVVGGSLQVAVEEKARDC